MAFYKVNTGDVPNPTDVNQYADALSANNDIGAITLAANLAAPAAPTAATATGTGLLGVGTYQYAITFVTGYKKTNGTLVYNGETALSPAATVTTTSGNQIVNLSNIATSAASYVIARRIYRTKVNGSTFYKVAEISDNTTTNYVDNTPDSSLTITAPTGNTTGTYFPAIYVGSDQRGQLFASGNTMIHMQNLTGSLFNEAKLANYICANSYYDGTNWNRFDTTQPAASIVVQTNGQPQFRSIGSGSNPISWNIYNIFHEGNFNTRTHVLAYLGSAQQNLVINSWNRVLYDTTIIDYLSEFDTTNHYFVAANTGIYMVSFGVRLINIGNPGTANFILGTNQLNRSGNAYNVFEDHNNASTVQYFATQVLYLSAGTQLECRVWQDSGTAASIATGQSNTWLNISRIA